MHQQTNKSGKQGDVEVSQSVEERKTIPIIKHAYRFMQHRQSSPYQSTETVVTSR